MSEELKRCAHCGTIPGIPIKRGDSRMWPNWRMFHVCKKMGEKPGMMSIEISGETPEQYIEYWNRRYTEPTGDARGEDGE